MDFSELKNAIRKGVPIQEPDFIKDDEESLNIGYMDMRPTEKLVFSISTFKNKKYFSIRNWYQAESGEWARTKKGVNLAFDKFAEFENFIKLIAQSIQLDQ